MYTYDIHCEDITGFQEGRKQEFGLINSLGSSEWIISIGDYVNNSLTALRSSDPREVRKLVIIIITCSLVALSVGATLVFESHFFCSHAE